MRALRKRIASIPLSVPMIVLACLATTQKMEELLHPFDHAHYNTIMRPLLADRESGYVSNVQARKQLPVRAAAQVVAESGNTESVSQPAAPFRPTLRQALNLAASLVMILICASFSHALVPLFAATWVALVFCAASLAHIFSEIWLPAASSLFTCAIVYFCYAKRRLRNSHHLLQAEVHALLACAQQFKRSVPPPAARRHVQCR